MSSSSVRSLSPLVLSAVALAIASSAAAGPLNPSHRLERVGRQTDNVAAALNYPAVGRMVVLTHDGDIRLTSGDGLVDELLMHIDVSALCPEDGLLGGTWSPTAPGGILYVTYVNNAAPRKFVVARIDFAGRVPSAPVTLYQVSVPATACTNLGGGIAVGQDGKLYVGIGDFGNQNGAQQLSTIVGKILRLNADAPGGVPTDNPATGSPVYGSGVRNPVRLAANPAGPIYFADVAVDPGRDELNLVTRLGNYGWPRGTGPQGAPFVDPIFSWTTRIQPVGLAVYQGSNLGPSAIGTVIVAGALDGSVRQLTPNPPNLASEVILSRATVGEFTGFVDLAVRDDGYIYLPNLAGETWRFRSDSALTEQPSDEASILPLLVKKASGGQLQITVERETAIESYGLYTGAVGNYYSHPAISSDLHAADANLQSAWSSFTIPAGTDPAEYFLASSVSAREETGLGIDSFRVARPGGVQTFGCPCPPGEIESPRTGDCREPWTLAQGMQEGAVIGPVTFDETWDCNVILMDLSEGWCYFCHMLAPDLDQLYADYRDDGFTLITLISEGYGSRSAAATMATIQQWNDDPCYPDFAPCGPATNPIILDPVKAVMNRYFNASGTCNGWPQSIVFDADGVQTDVICGADPAGARAAVERNLRRAGYIP
jgi:glucose/arabinose dehydrogenase